MKNILPLAILAVTCCMVLFISRMPGLASSDGLLVKGGDLMSEKPEGYPSAVFGGGCFWCVESEFRALDGVKFTRVGYMGGDLESPTYRDITTGETGHAEVVEVTYDPSDISYKELVEFFLTRAHDPTQLNRQGVDEGTQYRSVIFYGDEEQKQVADKVIAEVNKSGRYDTPVVTQLVRAGTFWEGEEYHQQYYEKYKAEKGVDHLRVILKKAKKL